MPKLWTDTMDTHRSAVRAATLDATAALIAERGLTSVTMSEIAKQAGIGRATLYKYFPDVDSIVTAWHERQINSHLEYLAEIRDRTQGAREQLAAVLTAYANLSHEHHADEMAASLHRGAHVAQAQQHLTNLVRDLIAEGARAGDLRADVAPAELASYCLNALGAAGGLGSKAAVGRLVRVTLSGLRADREIGPLADLDESETTTMGISGHSHASRARRGHH